jgi:hypothetical protein
MAQLAVSQPQTTTISSEGSQQVVATMAYHLPTRRCLLSQSSPTLNIPEVVALTLHCPSEVQPYLGLPL